MEENLMDVKAALGVSYKSSLITRLASGMFIYVYGTPLPLSSVSLSLVSSYFTFRTTKSRVTWHRPLALVYCLSSTALQTCCF
jgi:hypothetical protein